MSVDGPSLSDSVPESVPKTREEILLLLFSQNPLVEILDDIIVYNEANPWAPVLHSGLGAEYYFVNYIATHIKNLSETDPEAQVLDDKMSKIFGNRQSPGEIIFTVWRVNRNDTPGTL